MYLDKHHRIPKHSLFQKKTDFHCPSALRKDDITLKDTEASHWRIVLLTIFHDNEPEVSESGITVSLQKSADTYTYEWRRKDLFSRYDMCSQEPKHAVLGFVEVTR